MRIMVREMKDRWLEGEILSYAWLPTKHMWADVLTKEMPLPNGLETTLVSNTVRLPSLR